MSTTVLSPEPCILGEGPHWDTSAQLLYYVDLIGANINKFNPSTDEYTRVKLETDYVSFIIPRKENPNECYIGSNRNLQIFDWTTRKTTHVTAIEDELPNNRFNDGKCDPAGRLWAGTMAIENPRGHIPRDQGSLYVFDLDKSCKKVLSPVSISNGLTWSLDNKIFYYIDSPLRRVEAFDYDIQSGSISNRRVVADFNHPKYAPIDAMTCALPDGMTIDNDGKLWVAFFNGSRVLRLDPETGTPLKWIEIPASKVTSCCFGGPMLEDLYVTTAQYGLEDLELKQEPLAGHVFCIKGLGVKGQQMVHYNS